MFNREKQMVFYFGISCGLGLAFLLSILVLFVWHLQVVSMIS